MCILKWLGITPTLIHHQTLSFKRIVGIPYFT